MNIEESKTELNLFINSIKSDLQEDAEDNFRTAQAIEILLKAYEKEKEKNKELEIKNKELNLVRLVYLVEVFPNTTETHKKYMQELRKLLKELEE